MTPQILAALIVARLAYNLTNGFYLNLQDWRNALRGKQLTVAATITLFVVTLMAGQIFRPLYLQATDVATSGTNAPYLVQQYLDEAVPRNAVIATFESSLGVLTNHAYKFAPYSLVVDLTVKQPVGIPVNTTLYSFLFAQNPEYVIIGPFAESIDPNVSERMKVAYDLIFKADDYEVYRWKGQTF